MRRSVQPLAVSSQEHPQLGHPRPRVMLVAGNRQAQAAVRVVTVDDDGQVHSTVLPGFVDKNRHLVGRAL